MTDDDGSVYEVDESGALVIGDPEENDPVLDAEGEAEGIFDLRSPLAQRAIECQLVYAGIQQTRSQLAQAKLNWLFATAGLLGAPAGSDLHPNKIKAAIDEHLRVLDLLVAQADAMEANQAAMLALPTKLEVAGSADIDGLTAGIERVRKGAPH